MNPWVSYRNWRARRRLRTEAFAMLKEAHRIKRRYGHRLTAAQAKDLDARANGLRTALTNDSEIRPRLEQLESLLDKSLAFAKKSQARQYVESIGAVVFVALVLRSFVVEAYQIPSGSMIPTLDVGDRIWVNKLIYGVRLPFTDIKLATHYRPPRRGEIIVFEHPKEPDKDLIKRVIAVAGDKIDVRDEVVYVNGVATERVHEGDRHYWDYNEPSDSDPGRWVERDGDAWREQAGAAQFTTFYNHLLDDKRGPYDFNHVTVPPDSLFVMGDNRDNSNDSRFWGFVPLNLVRGKAMVVWWSSGEPDGESLMFSPRWSRLGRLIK